MTPDERRLIEDLFERLAAQRPQGKDRQAEALIYDLVRDYPDSAYMLVQTLLVYEHQLQDAADRIQSLEAELDDRGPAQATGGSFLSGRTGSSFGGRQAAGRSTQARSSNDYRDEATSVPRAGGSAPWGSKGPASAPNSRNIEPPRAAGGGGFFRSAMATAAGVAGGMLAADSLRSIFGGSSEAHAADANKNSSDSSAQSDAGAHQNTSHDDSSSDDNSNQDWGMDDFGGGDLDI